MVDSEDNQETYMYGKYEDMKTIPSSKSWPIYYESDAKTSNANSTIDSRYLREDIIRQVAPIVLYSFGADNTVEAAKRLEKYIVEGT